MLVASRIFDPRFLAWAAVWSVASLLVLGVASAIVPNPVFGRQIPPEPFAIATWLMSAPLMGLVAATYTVPAPPPAVTELTPMAVTPSTGQDGGLFGSIAGIGTFLAIGCPVCNKVALLLLGSSGAMSLYAPVQPIIGGVSLALLAGTLVWRLRLRVRGATCAT